MDSLRCLVKLVRTERGRAKRTTRRKTRGKKNNHMYRDKRRRDREGERESGNAFTQTVQWNERMPFQNITRNLLFFTQNKRHEFELLREEWPFA